MQECRRHNIHKRHGACRAYWARPTTVFYDVSISRSASVFIDAEGLEDEVDEYSNNAQLDTIMRKDTILEASAIKH